MLRISYHINNKQNNSKKSSKSKSENQFNFVNKTVKKVKTEDQKSQIMFIPADTLNPNSRNHMTSTKSSSADNFFQQNWTNFFMLFLFWKTNK